MHFQFSSHRHHFTFTLLLLVVLDDGDGWSIGRRGLFASLKDEEVKDR
jgi:hypothetical protein